MFTEDVQMSALGQRRTYAAHKLMSAFPPIATAKADMPHEALVSLVCASGATDGTKCATPGTAATGITSSRQQNAQCPQRTAIADRLANELAPDLMRAGPDHFHRHVEHDRKPDPSDPMVARQQFSDVSGQ